MSQAPILGSLISKRLRSIAERQREGRTREQALAESISLDAPRKDLLEFLRFTWWNPQPLAIGLHTRLIAERIDRAIADFEAGKSTYLVITVPFRHGKSELVSRALPAYFLGRCASHQPDVICTSYAASLSQQFSRRAKAIVDSWQYRKLFPGVRRSSEKDTEALWKVDYLQDMGGGRSEWQPSSGEAKFVGLGGAITGSGYHLGVVDDYCSNREDAESPAQRDSAWNYFAESFFTRAAPVSITIITATPWNVDDVIGRIKAKMSDDPEFPRFEFMRFPANGPAEVSGKLIKYPGATLFPERFADSWYSEKRATLGKYGAAGLLDCAPTIREGNLFRMNAIHYCKDMTELPTAARWVRFWDLASTKKEIVKDSPDFTAGALVAVTKQGTGANAVNHLWIRSIVAGQWNAPERNRLIAETARRDGPHIRQAVEQVGGYKDAVDILTEILKGVSVVHGVPVHVDKVTRAASLEPLFEAGNVHVLRGPWNALFEEHFRLFPSGPHDDLVDAVSGGYLFALDMPPGFISRAELGL